MEDREEYLERFRIDNEKMLSHAADMVKNQLGDQNLAIRDLLQDKQKIAKMVNNLSDSDFEKLKYVLDNPQIMDKILGSEKAKKNLAKLIGDL